MSLPDSLPAQLYLLAVDQRRQRLTGQTLIGYLLMAAALSDLQLRDLVRDDDGKVATTGRPRTGDPLLDGVLDDIAASRPLPWGRWVRRRLRGIRDTVAGQLQQRGHVELEAGRRFGIFPTTRVTVRDPAAVDRLRGRLTHIVEGAKADPREGALVVLAAAGELPTVFSGRQRRANRKRIKELSEFAGPAGPALRKVINQVRGAAASGGG
jgi:hypothetical protein